MTAPNCYFNDLILRQALLREHGLERSLESDELTYLTLDLADKIEALYAALGLRAVADHRGRMSVVAVSSGGERNEG
jgi:hypothetical protein